MKDGYIAAKERWARKVAGRQGSVEGSVVRSEDRLPPGQHLVTDFPVLDLGILPEVRLSNWSLRIHGRVERPVTLDWEGFLAVGSVRDVSDFHCVTTWSQYDMVWDGVPFVGLAELAGPKEDASHVLFRAHDGYTTCLGLEALMDEDVLVAHAWEGRPLTREHGGPARVIVPKRYAWKGAKWVKEMIFLDREIPGFWELRGYSSSADPWRAERFSGG
ncbi:MAG: sulfite oxidase-like oxidoreductase [Verrucomicrobiae bacterium]|nr:sulfite oxidase-like oxidoreductase [Verrucomicrobiae bacterium]